MRRSRAWWLAVLAGAGACEVGQRSLCLDLTANEVERSTGCVQLQSDAVPAERCAACTDGNCGVDLACGRSSCVLDPTGRVHLVFCVDAAQRTWPAGWKPLTAAQARTSAALTEAQRATCLASKPWERLCGVGRR